MSIRWVSVGLAGAWALGLASTAGAEESGFVPEQGSLWTALVLELWSADERFAGPFGADVNFRGFPDPDNPDAFDPDAAPQVEPGDVVPLKLDVPGASFRTLSVSYKLRVVPLPRLLVSVAPRIHQRSQFEQAGTRVETVGTGDFFASIGYQVTAEGLPVGTAFYVHAKFPTTRAQLEDLSVPLSEGQVDLGIEQATTWAILPQLWLTGRLQYRHRFAVERRVGGATARIKPGDEMEAGAEVAGEPLSLLWLKTSYTGVWATASEDRSVPDAIVALEKRQNHWWGADAYYRFGAWLSEDLAELALDLKLRYPLGGTDYLRGARYEIGIAFGTSWNRW